MQTINFKSHLTTCTVKAMIVCCIRMIVIKFAWYVIYHYEILSCGDDGPAAPFKFANRKQVCLQSIRHYLWSKDISQNSLFGWMKMIVFGWGGSCRCHRANIHIHLHKDTEFYTIVNIKLNNEYSLDSQWMKQWQIPSFDLQQISFFPSSLLHAKYHENA